MGLAADQHTYVHTDGRPQITVYVRPCLIGEYLSPTLDQCLACSPGYYNFNHTANQCQPCDADAMCSDPDAPGMIVPSEGFWQSNFFSEQVRACVANGPYRHGDG